MGDHIVNPGLTFRILRFTFLLHTQNADGTGLAFVALTEAINHMPGSIFWSILLFLMLVMLGLDSMFGGLEGSVTSLKDIKITGRLPVQVIIRKLCPIFIS